METGSFGSPPTEMMIREWRTQRKDLINADKSKKKTLRSCAPKWPKLEEYVKNWIIDHRKNGIAVSTKMILIEARRLATEMSITDFAGRTSWCEIFMRRNGLCMCAKTIIIIGIIIGIQPLGRSGQRPEFSQATGMALVRCILGKFLGVACHCFLPAF